MKYFKIIEDPLKVFGEKARGKNSNSNGFIISGNSQMIVNGILMTYGKIINELSFERSFKNTEGIEFFDTIEAVETDIEESYIEEFILGDAVALQLDLQLSGKDKIKDYDPEQSIDSQHNLKKIKDAKMGGVKVSNRKAKLD